MNLETNIGSLKLKNPIILASGTCAYGNAHKDFLEIKNLGAVVSKGISLQPREGNPPPRICEVENGILNSIGLENIGVSKFINTMMPLLRRKKAVVIVNIFGEQEKDYSLLCQRLNNIKGISALELNLSCPNVEKGGIEFGRDKKSVQSIAEQVKKVSTLPIWVKLSCNRIDPVEIAKAAETGGADAIVMSNTLKGMAIELEKKRPALARITGGLSGPAIKPVALAAVFETVRAVKIPVVACGGIFTGRDALEFLLAGAKAVEVGTAALVNPLAPLEIISEMKNYLMQAKVKSLDDWIGTIQLGG